MSTIRDVVKTVKRKAKTVSRKLENFPKNIKAEVSRMVEKMHKQMHKRLVSLEKKIHKLNGDEKPKPTPRKPNKKSNTISRQRKKNTQKRNTQ